MSDSPLTKRLLLKPGTRALVLNAPLGYLERLNPLPDGACVAAAPDGSGYDWVHLFVGTVAELAHYAPAAVAALKPGGILWVSYPKISSKVKTDINRDRGWDAITDDGWRGVTQISVDDTWSALRFKK